MRISIFCCWIVFSATACLAQRGMRSEPIADHPQDVGDPGIAWYTTWKTGLAEAKRSGQPIFFMSAATCSRGVSGAF